MRLRNIPGAKEEIRENRFVVQDPRTCRGRWEEVFTQTAGRDPDRARQLMIEIGMGKGRFLMEMAALYPGTDFVGIEMYDSVLLRAVQRRGELAKEGREFDNLLFIREDARLLPEIFGPGEVSGIFLNFSDPWPKARHDKRRLTSRQFLERYRQVLTPGGRVEFKTDNQVLFDFSLEEAREAGWEILCCTRDLHHDPVLMEGNVMTEYEEKFSSLGKPICKMITAPRDTPHIAAVQN